MILAVDGDKTNQYYWMKDHEWKVLDAVELFTTKDVSKDQMTQVQAQARVQVQVQVQVQVGVGVERQGKEKMRKEAKENATNAPAPPPQHLLLR